VTAVDQLQLDETRTGMFGAVSVRATTPVFPRTVLVAAGRGGEKRLVATGRARDLVETHP